MLSLRRGEGAKVNRTVSGVIAVLLLLACAMGGTLAGAMIGNLIVAADLTWSGSSTPGLMVVGGFLGLVAGFAFGLYAAMRVVDEAKAGRDSAIRFAEAELPPPPPERDPGA